MQRFTSVFLLSCILILLPAIESSLLGNALGLQWGSEKLMYYVSALLVPLKLFMVLGGCWFLLRFVKANNVSRRALLLIIPVLFIASVQVLFLSLTTAYYIFNGTKANNYIEQGSISIQSQAPGKLLTAFHQISVRCDAGYGFYHLEVISKEPWLGKQLKIERLEEGKLLEVSFTQNATRAFKSYSLEEVACTK